MDTKGFRYEFTFKEMVYFLFRKKVCPCCKGSLQKVKVFDVVISDSRLNFGREIKQYSYRYKCKSCGKEYSLGELSK